MPTSGSKALIEKRRTLVGEYFMKGLSYRAIKAELNKQPEFAKTSVNTVMDDVHAIEKRLMAENDSKIEASRARSIGVLRKVQQEAWGSIQVNHLSIPLPLKDKASYLRVIVDAEEKIAKLQGTFAPVKTEIAGREGKPITLQLVPAKVENDGS